jgi:tetratricopeptide (TPR) repeat protein
MLRIRKVTLGLLLAPAFSALALAGFLLWNYVQAQELPASSAIEERTKQVRDRVEALSKRSSDLELLVVILLGASGLYSIIFVASSYFSSKSFARQADRSIAEMKDQLATALGDLRRLQDEAKRTRQEEPPPPPPPKIADERPMAEELAGLYRSIASVCTQTDPPRAIDCLHRALALAPSSEVHYELACAHAAAGDFHRAVQELAIAFQNQSLALDERLARDIEEGGRLYELASRPPFDKAVNDVLLNVVL